MSDKFTVNPPKGILKTSQSFEARSLQSSSSRSPFASKEMKWDEMNILATLHPVDKEYGHMRIDEPKTPYERKDYGNDIVDANQLNDRLIETERILPKCLNQPDDTDDDDDEVDLSLEQIAEKRQFEKRRKEHYNEFLTAKLAYESLDEETEEEDDNDADDEEGEEMDTFDQNGK